jgi:glycosyltransferase involved in cell wall biosynthesis
MVAISRHLLRAHALVSPIREVIHNSYQAEGTLPLKSGEGPLKVGFLGRLFETKGIELLIDAVQQTDSAHLYLAGQGSPAYTESLRQRAPARTTFLGIVPPRSLFETIDVLVVPSLWHEPFGRVAIEAMAWGIPVIASRRGGLPEIIQDGVNGWLFEPNEAEALSQFLRNLTPEICRSKREACLRRSRAFRPEVITVQYEQLYDRVLFQHEMNLRYEKPSPSNLSEATPAASSHKI